MSSTEVTEAANQFFPVFCPIELIVATVVFEDSGRFHDVVITRAKPIGMHRRGSEIGWLLIHPWSDEPISTFDVAFNPDVSPNGLRILPVLLTGEKVPDEFAVQNATRELRKQLTEWMKRLDADKEPKVAA